MASQIDALKDRIFSKSKGTDRSGITDIIEVVRSLGCLGEIIGRTFEVYDKNDNHVYTVKQKPIKLSQLNILLKEVNTLKNIDAENEAAKWGSKKKGRLR